MKPNFATSTVNVRTVVKHYCWNHTEMIRACLACGRARIGVCEPHEALSMHCESASQARLAKPL